MNLCTEAFSPNASLTQVELSVRELRLFARKEAANELPGARNVRLISLYVSIRYTNAARLISMRCFERYQYRTSSFCLR